MRKKVLLFSFFTVCTLISLYFDREIFEGVSLIRNFALNDFFLGITFVSSEIIIFFVLTSLFLWRDNKRRWIAPLWLTLALSAVVSFLLKVSIQRQRPFQLGFISTLPVLEKASYLVWNFSFPSFQAMLAFCALPLLNREFPRFRYFWGVFAVLVAFSRVYFGLHFLSDVLAGGLIGYAIGLLIVMAEKENRFGERIYKKIFRRR